MRRLLILMALLATGCPTTTLAPFGQLRKPVGVAYQVLTGNVFVGAADADEVRVLLAGQNPAQFALAPALLFPLSIPTVPWPAALAAGDRTVFVMSPPTSSLGFIDTTPPGGGNPRSVDDDGGTAVQFPLRMLPTGLVDFTSGGTDHALVVGASASAGTLLAVSAQVIAGDPAKIEASLDLGDALPAAVALEPELPESILSSNSIADCRAVAVADDGTQPGHVPGVLLTHAEVDSSGVLSFKEAPLALPVRVPIELEDGTVELRAAPVRFLAFTPAPFTEDSLAVSIVDPCALRSGRLFLILDPVYCGNVVPCPDVAMIDIPSGDIAFDQAGGNRLAIYDVPGAALEVGIPSGPFSLPSTSAFGGGFDRTVETVNSVSQNTPVTNDPALALVSSSTGGLIYFSPGLGTFLVGPAEGDRAPSDTAFPVDGNSQLPSVGTPVRQGQVAGAAPPPVLILPSGSGPTEETITAAFRSPLPGFSQVGTFGAIDLTTNTLRAPAGPTSFLTPVPLIAEPDPAPDVVVPVTTETGCPEWPVKTVSPDGLSITLDIQPPLMDEPATCRAATTQLAILPSTAKPWLLTGSVTGFFGRVHGCPTPTPADQPTNSCSNSTTDSTKAADNSNVFEGSQLLFQFVPPFAAIPQGAIWTIPVSNGFSFVVAEPAPASVSATALNLLPAGMAVVPPGTVHPPTGGLRLFVAYSGSDALVGVDPQRPGTDALVVFQ